MRFLITITVHFILVFSFYSSLQAQPIVTEGNSWNVSWGQTWSHGTFFYKLEDTTVINGTTYAVVKKRVDTLSSWNPIGQFLRQDGPKIYHYYSIYGTEVLYYDFSMSIGDTLYNRKCYYVVTAIDYITLSPSLEQKKRIELLAYGLFPTYIPFYWIEDVGSDWGILYDDGHLCNVDGIEQLLCFYRNDTLIHLADPITGCILPDNSSVEKPRQASTIASIFPNPFQDVLHLNVESAIESAEANIYNTQGSLIKTMHINNSNNTVPVQDLVSGVYFIVIKTSDNQLFSQKLIKD